MKPQADEVVGRIVDEVFRAAAKTARQIELRLRKQRETRSWKDWITGREIGKDNIKHSDRENIEVSVRATIKLLRPLMRAPLRGKRQRIVEDDLPSLLKQIEGLQKQLKKTSNDTLFLLLSGEDDVKSDKIPGQNVQQKAMGRARNLRATLEYLRLRCQFLLEKRPGEHGSADYRQRHVAQETWRLLKLNGIEPTGGALGSVYGSVASLIWEAVMGEPNRDLQWACKAALRLANEGGLQPEGRIIGRGQFPLS